MGDFANIIYKQFFMRDLLGKVLPGTIVLVALYLWMPKEIQSKLLPPSGLSWYIGLIWFSFSLVFGLGLQVVAEGIGFHSAHPCPLTRFFFRTKDGEKARDLFRTRQAQFQKDATDKQIEQRERYVYLKEGSGNVAFSLLFLLVSYYEDLQLCVMILIIASVLWWTHIVHRSRQTYYEMKVLNLLSNESASKGSQNSYSSDTILKYIGSER